MSGSFLFVSGSFVFVIGSFLCKWLIPLCKWLIPLCAIFLVTMFPIFSGFYNLGNPSFPLPHFFSQYSLPRPLPDTHPTFPPTKIAGPKKSTTTMATRMLLKKRYNEWYNNSAWCIRNLSAFLCCPSVCKARA